jgi:hypothetical protein
MLDVVPSIRFPPRPPSERKRKVKTKTVDGTKMKKKRKKRKSNRRRKELFDMYLLNPAAKNQTFFNWRVGQAR